MRALARDHPHVFPLIATRHPAAPAAAQPRGGRGLHGAELTSRGFSDASAVGAYRAFFSFLLGHLLLEAASRGASTVPAEEVMDEGDAEVHLDEVDVSRYPQITRLRPMLSQDHDDEEFELALENLLNRLETFVGR